MTSLVICRYKQIFVILQISVVILILIKVPTYFQVSDESGANKHDLSLKFVPSHNDKTTVEINNVLGKQYKKSSPVKVIDALELIRRDCGQLCNTSRLGSPGLYFDHITATVDCLALFRNEYIDRTHGLEQAPKTIPKELMNEFTMNGRLKVSEWYFDQPFLQNKKLAPVWTRDMVEHWISLAKQGKLGGNYGESETNALRDGLQHAPGVQNGRVLVIGSAIPWVEACVLEAGAKEIVTLEYREIISRHPQIKTTTPSKFRESYLDNTLGTFDAVVTFSSVEHSGLGRYGDALNPWGDIIAVARGWCVTRKGGSLTIGVMYDYNNDNIKFNAGRWYGTVRYPYLTTNWRQLYRGKGSQRVYVFTKGRSDDNFDIQHYLREPQLYKSLKNSDVKYSQAKQDKTVYDLFPTKDGIFIEMGAFNGISLSNTLWLERHHNWTGLLIEANPDLCDAIDNAKRHVWRLCGCISSEAKTTFIQGGPLGSAEDTVDPDHMKQLNPNLKIIVPCFKLDKVLDTINHSHINYFSLDVEGAELFVLNTIKSELQSERIIVDVWTIEYRVWDGTKIIPDKSRKKLEELRKFFKAIGGYVEHSQLSINRKDTSDGAGLDVVFVNIKTWCKNYEVLPSGAKC